MTEPTDLLAGIDSIPPDAVVLGCVRVVCYLAADGTEHVVAKFDGEMSETMTVGMLAVAQQTYLDDCLGIKDITQDDDDD